MLITDNAERPTLMNVLHDFAALKKIPKGKDIYINKSRKSLLKADKTMNPDQTRHPYFVGTLKQYATAPSVW